MGRWQCTLAGLLGLLAICGCAAHRSGNPFASKSAGSVTAQNARRKPGVADKAVADGKNATGSGSVSDADSRSAAPGTGSATQAGTQTGGHDPQTMAYIDRELRDATPEERSNYMNSLQGMHPEAVRQVLHSRRLTMQAVKQKQYAGTPPAVYSQGAIQTAAADAVTSAAALARRVDSAEGLGSMSAWPRQTGDANQSPPTIITAGAAADSNNSQNGSLAPQIAGQPPLGHSSGYLGNPEFDLADGAGATVRPGTAPYGQLPPAAGQLTPGQYGTPGHGQYGVAQAGGTLPSGTPRGATAGRAPVVAVGAPMSASSAPQRAAGSALAPNITAEGGARDQLARYISTVESEAFELQPGETESEKQTYIEKQVHLRMLYLMSGQQERALQAIPGLDPADQEFWQQTFWGLANYFDVNSIPSSSDRAAQTVTQLTNAVLRLQGKARLELRNVTFCHKISSFGNYEKYPRDEFSPGQEVLLYAEVANTHSEPIPDGKFKTSLKSTLEVYRHGTQGELIERIDLPETVDVCRTHRRDYFHSYQFTIPAKLALGPHVLKLSVEDQLSRRVGTYTLNFMVK
jgi:hypothetical protein